MKSVLPLPSYTGQSVTVYPHMPREMCLCLEAKDTNHALIFTFCFFYYGIYEIRKNKHIVIKIVMIQKQPLICFTEILLQIPQSVLLVASHVFLQAHIS